MLRLLVEASVASWRPILERENITLSFEVGDDIGYVNGNEDYLRQVLNNVLDNARKFSPEGGTTRVIVKRVQDGVQVTVADDGVGVEPERLARLFERFYQVDGGMTRRFEGMGLGLSLSHEIVRRHGGRIWAEERWCWPWAEGELHAASAHGAGIRMSAPEVRDLIHELNNVFQSIVGFAELVARDPNLPEASSRRLRVIEEQGRRGADLVALIAAEMQGEEP